MTSPPYWGLRAYGGDVGMIGLEASVDEWVANLVAVFGEVRRVLRDDGTLWLNLGDAYAGSGRGGNPSESPFQGQRTNPCSAVGPLIGETARIAATTRGAGEDRNFGFKAKDLMGLPWRVAFALQADGWYLRSDIIWHKPNPMPESAGNRALRPAREKGVDRPNHSYSGGLASGGRMITSACSAPGCRCNPPFSRLEGWVAKAWRELEGGCPVIVMLLPANRAEQTFWQQQIEPFRDGRGHAAGTLDTKFISGRVDFTSPKGKLGRAPFGCVLLTFKSRL